MVDFKLEHPDHHNDNATMSISVNGMCASIAINLKQQAMSEDRGKLQSQLQELLAPVAASSLVNSVIVEIGRDELA